MSKALEELRLTIDSLDDRIHDLLMERAELISRISAEKKRAGAPIIQPAREARMIRRLLDRHKGPLAPAAIARIWRELVGAVSLLQIDVRVSVCTIDKNPGLWDMARDYFGSVIPLQKTANPLTAIAQLRENECAFAVLPWPEDGEDNPWWGYLDGRESTNGGDFPLRIVVRLPLGDRAGHTPDPNQLGLVVAKVPFEPTGDDRSFVLVDADHSLSRARLVSVAAESGLAPLRMASRRSAGPNAPSRHLLEVGGYASAEALEALHKRLEDCAARCLCIGGYPVPPLFERAGQGASQTPREDGQRASV